MAVGVMARPHRRRRLIVGYLIVVSAIGVLSGLALAMHSGGSGGVSPQDLQPDEQPRAFPNVAARVGPGAVSRVVHRRGYRLAFGLTPNRVLVENRFGVRLTRDGVPVRGAKVKASFTMVDHAMGIQVFPLSERSSGRYEASAPSLIMVGRWGVEFAIKPPGRQAFTVRLLDQANP
jgi:hypothetical protein